MRIESLARPSVLSQPVYQPGKPIDYVARELGLDPAGIIKLASNENPFGASPRAIEAAIRALAQGALYPDGGCYELRRRLASFHGLGADQFVVGNGSNELIELLGHVFLGPGDEVVMATPAFVVYKLVTLLFGAKPVEVPLRDWTHDLPAMAAAVTPRTKLVCVCSPNNPTGTANSGEQLEAFIRAMPDHVVVVIDEAYIEYLENPPDLKPLIREGKNLICLRTFSKIYGLAALRVGYGYASPDLCALLERVRQPFNVNAIGQAAALAALDDKDFADRCRRANAEGMAAVECALSDLGFKFVRSCANFVLSKVGDGTGCFSRLQQRGIIVRPMVVYGLNDWVRITIGNPEANGALLEGLRAWRFSSKGCPVGLSGGFDLKLTERSASV
jgi:histidinol-phosphate aminotransferase